MKFCPNCGKQNEDAAGFCENCGSKLDVVVPEVKEPVIPKNLKEEISEKLSTSEKVVTAEKPASTAKKKNLLMIIIIAGGVLAAAVVVLLIILLSGGSKGAYEKAVKDFEDVMNGDLSVKKIEGMLPADTWEYYEDEYDVTVDDVIDEIDDWLGSEFDFGIDYEEAEFALSVVKANKITDEDVIEGMVDAIEDEYDVKKKQVGDIYRLIVDVEITFDIEDADKDYRYDAQVSLEDGYRNTMYAAKIDGKWYLMRGYIYYDSYSEEFDISVYNIFDDFIY